MLDQARDLLLFAAAAALTPTAILAALLLLLTPRPRENGVAYLTGWMAGLFAAAAVLLALGSEPAIETTLTQTTTARPGIVFLAGLAMVVGGILGLRGGRVAAKEPAWLRRVDTFSPRMSFGLGALLGGLSPKLLLLTGAAVVTLIYTQDSPVRRLVGLLVYILVASIPILVPVVLVVRDPARAGLRLAGWKTWLIEHQGQVLGAGSILLGLMLVALALDSAAAAT